MTIHVEYKSPHLNTNKGISFTIPSNGITALFGASGSGKTTLLRVVAGLEKIPNSIVKFNDQIWQDSTTFIPTHLRNIGYLFQDVRLFEHLSVSGNLSFASKRSSITNEEETKVIDDLQLGDLLNRMPIKLSGGEKQRVALARCLLSKPRLLLLDEPFNALDQATNKFITEYVKNLNLPTIYVSHSLEEVMRMADYVVHIQYGQILDCGSINKMLYSLGKDGIVVSGKLVSFNAGNCVYDTNFGQISFRASVAQSLARIFIDSRNLRLYRDNGANRIKLYINSITDDYECYIRLNLTINNEEVSISVHKDMLINTLISTNQFIYAEILQADIL